MFEIGLFHPHQLRDFQPHEVYRGCFTALQAQAEEIYANKNCHSVALYIDGRVEGLMGLSVMWQGNADCWTVLSRKACSRPVSLQKTALFLMEKYALGLGLRRISAGSDVRFPASSRWLESMGFVREGTMRKYGPDGADWHLYARVF